MLGLIEALDLLGNLACAPFTIACAVAGAAVAYAIGGGGGLVATGAMGGMSLGLWLDFGVSATARAMRWPVGLLLVAVMIVAVAFSVFAGGQ